MSEESDQERVPEAYQSQAMESISRQSLEDDQVSLIDLLDSFSVTPAGLTRRMGNTVRKKGEEFKDRVIKTRDVEIDRLKEAIIKQMRKIETRMSSDKIVTTAEKVTFALGLLNVFALGFIMGNRPEIFHAFYTAEAALLLPIRFYTYKKKEYQYYLADLCYFANAITLLYIWVFPSSEQLFISCYSLSFGTLSWAIITWRNSLVLHSIEKTTSTFIHILPPVVFHTIVHRLPIAYKTTRFPAAVKLLQWRFMYGLINTTIAYFVWQSLYHYFITVRRQEKIKAGRVTSFEYLRKSYGNTALGKFVNSLPGFLPVAAFTLIQFSYQLFTMLLCPIWYSNELCSVAFLGFIFLWASYNGATYYIDIFGKRFQKELLKLQAEMAEWQTCNGMKNQPNSVPIKQDNIEHESD